MRRALLGALGVVGMVGLGAPLTGCTGSQTPQPVKPSEPTCDAVPKAGWRLPQKEVHSPYKLPATEEMVGAAKALKDVVFTHARDPNNPWAISHAILAIGPDFELTNGRNAVDWLFETYAETFEVCGETLVRFPRKKGDVRIEPHTDLILKALTESGVDPARKVTVKGKPFTVGHLYRGSLHRAWVGSSTGAAETEDATVYDEVPFGPIGGGSGSTTQHWNDSPWALQGLATWAPKELAWKAKGGHDMTLDRFTSASIARLDYESRALQVQQSQGQPFKRNKATASGGLVSMTCGGAHMIQGSGYALARGYGTDVDKQRYDKQIELLFWRYDEELAQYDDLIKTQPRYGTLLLMQRLKFLGHFLETTHKWGAMGLFRPNAEQDRKMSQAAAQVVATVAVLQDTGIYANLSKLEDPAVPDIYGDVGHTNHQLYLDYVGDSAHAYRGLDIALGHGVVRY